MSNSCQTTGRWPSNLYQPDWDDQQRINKILPVFDSILAEEKIPQDPLFTDALKYLYIPLSQYLTNKQKGKPLIVGINGSQGSGKSTLTKILSAILKHGFNKKVVSFSIDDLYKSKDQRQLLAEQIHPLLETRGAPGTHDAELGISILNHLLEKKPSTLLIPVFDKSIDDRLPEPDWSSVNEACDIVIFEGWCVGALAQEEASLLTPINKLEKQEDENGAWRNFVNQNLNDVYAELFSLINILLMLKVPDFEKVIEWRKLQEEKLKSSIANRPGDKNKTMNESEVERFIMHYERITRHTLDEMPERADIVLELGNDHHVKNVIVRNES